MKKLFLALSIFFLLLYFSASFLYHEKYVLYIKPLILPFFTAYIFLANHFKINVRYLLFIIFFYLGDCCILYIYKFPVVYELGLICYFFSYLSLLFLVLPFINSFSVLNEIRIYSIFTFFLIVSILVFLLDVIFDTKTEIFLTIIIVFDAIAAILLTFFAFIYLKQLFFKKSILFFFGSFSLFFSDVMSALQVYFVEDFLMNFIERILHFLGFYLIYLFYVEKHVAVEND